MYVFKLLWIKYIDFELVTGQDDNYKYKLFNNRSNYVRSKR